MISIPDPYRPLAKVLGMVISALLLLTLVWWLVIKPRSDLADERVAHAATKAKHAQVMAEIAAKSEAVARQAAQARDKYKAQTAEDQKKHEQEVKDAFERGKSVAAGIRDGSVSVRTVWRDRSCPQAVPGEGGEPGRGDEAVPAGRADAIGRILGYGGRWDADYKACYTRLTRAQELLNACYEDGGP